jgi:glycine/D-amino acid oxidase-like deaminating enzyme
MHISNRSHRDVVVVGARVAGASTAMLLARLGHDVVAVDQASFPSDAVAATPMAPPISRVTSVPHSDGPGIDPWGWLRCGRIVAHPALDVATADDATVAERSSARNLALRQIRTNLAG